MPPSPSPGDRQTVERIREELNSGEPDTPEGPEIVDIEVEKHEMASENALRVSVIVPDETPDDEMTWPDVRHLEEQIKQRFRDIGTSYYPVFRYLRESERDEQRA